MYDRKSVFDFATPWLNRLGTSSLILTCVLSGCARQPVEGAPEASVSVASQPKSAPTPLRVLTFNAGLAPALLPNVDARSQAIGKALGELDVDVACLQEVWLDRHYQSISEATKRTLPRSLRAPHAPVPAGKCAPAESARAFACVRRNCGDVSDASVNCIAKHCASEDNGVSPGCEACLVADPTRQPAETYEACVSSDPSEQARPSSEPVYVYGGSYGLALLFDPELVQSDFAAFDSEWIARGALYARLAVPAPMKRLHVFCTHLTPDSKQENERQVEALVGFIQQKVPEGEPVLLLGDLNVGPETRTLRAKLPEHWQKLVRAGFKSPYLGSDAPSCTFCDGNPLVAGRGAGGTVLDHTLLRNIDAQTRSTRVLDEPVELRVKERKFRSAYSDHYGVLSLLLVDGRESG
jgi:endonuclease/exonuclease/phosphatase family metal-dependent hydrolase